MVYRNICCVCIAILILVGCATQPNHVIQVNHQLRIVNAKPLTAAEKEQLMQKAKNYTGLITLYKRQLRDKKSNSVRFKLAHTYYLSGDCNSALFQLRYLRKHSRPESRIYYLSAQCLYQQGKLAQALRQVKLAIGRDPQMAQAYNLLGIINAYMDDFISAQRAFNQARILMYSDEKVLNNLAVIDIYQHHYQAAIDKLMPLYRNGQAGPEIRANLLFALAKNQQFELFKEVLGRGQAEHAKSIYQQLQTLHQKGLQSDEKSES
ncbi:MAG: hypothetical protein CENE_03564 [Candidatus Celerinatantimonas neptuna]|nr:MAG: hypothetical protein CENE_03564 [Candidatus Celerinatantimonas neptuna]